MNWLDSGSNGPCSETEGNPSDIVAKYPDTHVVFSNIRWGDIGSTVPISGGSPGSSTKPAPSSTSTRASTTTKPSQPAQTHYGQCGGNGWTGPTQCQSPYSCKKQNDWYSQCL
jgi:cellulase